MIFRRFLGILTDCLGSEANEDDINALSGLCVSTPPWPPLHKGGKLRLRTQQECAVGNGFYPPPRKPHFHQPGEKVPEGRVSFPSPRASGESFPPLRRRR
jgi:hypothetical protein